MCWPTRGSSRWIPALPVPGHTWRCCPGIERLSRRGRGSRSSRSFHVEPRAVHEALDGRRAAEEATCRELPLLRRRASWPGSRSGATGAISRLRPTAETSRPVGPRGSRNGSVPSRNAYPDRGSGSLPSGTDEEVSPPSPPRGAGQIFPVRARFSPGNQRGGPAPLGVGQLLAPLGRFAPGNGEGARSRRRSRPSLPLERLGPPWGTRTEAVPRQGVGSVGNWASTPSRGQVRARNGDEDCRPRRCGPSLPRWGWLGPPSGPARKQRPRGCGLGSSSGGWPWPPEVLASTPSRGRFVPANGEEEWPLGGAGPAFPLGMARAAFGNRQEASPSPGAGINAQPRAGSLPGIGRGGLAYAVLAPCPFLEAARALGTAGKHCPPRGACRPSPPQGLLLLATW
jgi:hypothetical protein